MITKKYTNVRYYE